MHDRTEGIPERRNKAMRCLCKLLHLHLNSNAKPVVLELNFQ